METDRISHSIAEFYLRSHDHNGICVDDLMHSHKLRADAIRRELAQLVTDGKVTLVFGSVQSNPNIKMLADLPLPEQLDRLEAENLDAVHAYPTATLVRAAANVSQYDDRPFAKRLLLGQPQLQPVYFELPVLERYWNDPRYWVMFADYSGSISIRTAYYRSEQTSGRDKVLLQSFGLGYDSGGHRLVVVYLRYLSGLSPEHQQYWNTYAIPSEGCRMAQDYYRTAILAEWPEYGSVYSALLEEQAVINEMCKLMERPPLFRDTYTGERRPREFSPFLRPTLENYSGFVLCLDKLLSENINKAFFKDDIPLNDARGHDKGTLMLLDEWIRVNIRVADTRLYDSIIEPLRRVRSLRQKPAHKIQENEYDTQFYSEQESLVDEVYRSVRSIRLLFANHPKARRCSVPDWLREGRIKHY